MYACTATAWCHQDFDIYQRLGRGGGCIRTFQAVVWPCSLLDRLLISGHETTTITRGANDKTHSTLVDLCSHYLSISIIKVICMLHVTIYQIRFNKNVTLNGVLFHSISSNYVK